MSAGTHAGGLAALNPTTGAVLWNDAFDDPVYRLPAIAGDGTIYVPIDTAVVAVAPNGTVLWKLPCGDEVGGVSVGGDGTIYATSKDENFYALNPDGTIRWTMPFGQAWGTPAIGADGTIYVRGASALSALGCGGGACGACVPNCTGKRCGPDGCGGLCGACGAGDRCDLLLRTCEPIAPPAGLDTAATRAASRPARPGPCSAVVRRTPRRAISWARTPSPASSGPSPPTG